MKSKIYLEQGYNDKGLVVFRVSKLVNTLDFEIGTILNRSDVEEVLNLKKHEIVIAAVKN